MPEYDIAAEQGVILAAFQDPSQVLAMLEKGVKPLSFGVVVFKAAWEAMMRLHLSDRPIDELRLQSELGPLWPRLAPLWKQAREATEPSEWRDFLPKLHAYQINRGVTETYESYRRWWGQDPERVTQYLPTFIHSLSEVGRDAQHIDPRPDVIYSRQRANGLEIPTGLSSLDRMLVGGWRPGELVLWAAPTKHGKTSMASTLTANQVAMGNNVIVFSLEMSERYFVCRVISTYAQLDWKDVAQNKVAPERQEDLRKTLAALGTHLRVYPPEIHTPDEIRERIKWHQVEYDKISLVIVDPIGLVQRKGFRQSKDTNMAYYLEEQAYALHNVATECDVPVCVFSQLSAQQEVELVNSPSHDLKTFATRGSAGVKHACDFGFTLCRQGTSEAIIRKKLDRISGQTDKAIIQHDPRYYWFHEQD